ncbi:NAD-binding protein [Collybia nuda]|uniref:NAD-binding protein n=1 Tax=Collybia nuda TaxID=64659 RepID=A0A9P5YG45_9AGAR|nr:NAD-binding protein [Collybia nuda]
MSPPLKTNILITGATGYIGGTVLRRFLAHPNASSFSITALVRSPEKATKLRPFGIIPVVGSTANLPFLEDLASKADVVLAMTNADDHSATQAILRGLRTHHNTTGNTPVLIHTSGTGVLTDDAKGAYASEVIYDDTNLAQLETLPPTQLHRKIDLAIINADAEGYVRSYIIIPSTVWGLATGPLVDLGVQNPISMQIPVLIDASVDRGQGGMVGAGKNLWGNVNIEDIADLYIILYDAIVANPDGPGHGRSGLYFGENGEHSLYEVGRAVSQALMATDCLKGESAEPTTFTKEEIALYFMGSESYGTNARCKSKRARAIGWRPVRGKADFLSSIKSELEDGRWKGAAKKFADTIRIAHRL